MYDKVKSNDKLDKVINIWLSVALLMALAALTVYFCILTRDVGFTPEELTRVTNMEILFTEGCE